MGKGHLNKNSHFVVASKVSYGDKASNSTNESHVTMNATATNTTTNATVVVSTSTDDSDSTSTIIGLIFGILGFIILAGLGVWLYLKWKQKKIIKDYTMNPESFLAPQKLSIAQKFKLSNWGISKDKKHQINDFTSKNQSNVLGSFIQLNFSQNEGVFQSIIADSSIDASKENSYFEVEIDNKPKNETTIVIGFASDADYIKTFYPGAYPSSVGFKSSAECIEVMMNTKAMITFEYKVKFGDTLGIGIRGKDGRIWFSYNGLFLNPPATSEKVLTDKEKKKKNDEFSKLDSDQQKIFKEKEAEFEAEAKKKKVTLMSGKKKLFPVIGTNGPAIINLNIGGSPFRLFQKEIATGLL